MKLFRPSEQARRSMPRRPSVVSVLDVGSTKICCLIARLTPNEADAAEAMRGRTHAIEVLGFGHQRSRGIKSGVVVNLDAAEQAIRLAVDAAERMAGVTVEFAHRQRLRRAARRARPIRPASRSPASRWRRPTSAACSPPAAGTRSARAARSSIRCRSAIRSTPTAASPIRSACSGSGSASTCTSSPPTRQPLGNLELAINRCHLSIERLVASPYRERAVGAGRRRGRARLRLRRFRRRHDHHRRLHEGRVRPCRRHRHRRPAHHHRHRPRAVDADRGRRAAEDDVWQRAAASRRRSRDPVGAADRRRGRAGRTRCRARR